MGAKDGIIKFTEIYKKRKRTFKKKKKTFISYQKGDRWAIRKEDELGSNWEWKIVLEESE